LAYSQVIDERQSGSMLLTLSTDEGSHTVCEVAEIGLSAKISATMRSPSTQDVIHASGFCERSPKDAASEVTLHLMG
jgi:hypothetical protein